MSIYDQIARGTSPGEGLIKGKMYADQQAQQQYQNTLAERKIGLQEQTYGLKEQEFQSQQRAARAKKLASVMLGAIANVEQQPEQMRPQTWAANIQRLESAGVPVDPRYKTYRPGIEQEAKNEVMGSLQNLDYFKPQKPPTSVQEYQYAQQNPGFAEWQLRKKKAGATTVNVGGTEPDEYTKEINKQRGKADAERLGAASKQATAARQELANLDRLESLLSGVSTGRLAPTTQSIKQYAKSVGVNLEALGITDDTSAAQAATALKNQMALELRNPAGGAGMPGAMSDKDREFLISMVPGIENTPEGIKTMIESKRRLAKRRQEEAKIIRDYWKDNKTLDGVDDELQRYADENPIFGDMGGTQAIGTQQAPASNIDEILKKYL